MQHRHVEEMLDCRKICSGVCGVKSDRNSFLQYGDGKVAKKDERAKRGMIALFIFVE